MRCQEALVEMSAALDGELDAEGASLLQAHLQTCHACQAEQERLRAVDQRLRVPALLAVRVPEELHARIARQIARPRPTSRRRASPLAFAVAFTGAAAAAAALAVARPDDSGSAAQGPASNDPEASPLDTAAAAAATAPAAASIRSAVAAARSATSGPGTLAPLSGPHAVAVADPGTAAPTDCRLALGDHSPVSRACRRGGLAEARRTMRALVDTARARGRRFECRDCHRNQIDFELDQDARERFASMLAAAGA
jgi:anti-sigma factor RsiW